MALESQNYYKLAGFGEDKKVSDLKDVIEIKGLVLGKCIASEALKIMREKDVKHLPVVSEEKEEE